MQSALNISPDSSVGKESTCNAGDPGSIPGLGRSAEEDGEDKTDQHVNVIKCKNSLFHLVF